MLMLVVVMSLIRLSDQGTNCVIFKLNSYRASCLVGGGTESAAAPANHDAAASSTSSAATTAAAQYQGCASPTSAGTLPPHSSFVGSLEDFVLSPVLDFYLPLEYSRYQHGRVALCEAFV